MFSSRAYAIVSRGKRRTCLGFACSNCAKKNKETALSMASQMQQYSIRLILYLVLYFVFNYAFNIQLVFNIQRVIQYSTSINIHLFILYSILHSPIQLSIQQFQPFIQHSTLIFKTFNYSLDCLQSTFSLKIRLVLHLIPRDCKPRCYYIGIETRREKTDC